MCGIDLLAPPVPPWEMVRPLGGHAPAVRDNRFPRMGGKPSKGTKKDKRLKKNKK